MPGATPQPVFDGEEDALRHALRVLASSREGVLSFGDVRQRVRFVSDNASGRLVCAVPPAALLATDHVLFIPDESDDALQLIVTPEETVESTATDRWQAHHGPPDHPRWALLWIESVKHGAWVFDGEALMIPNALSGAEASLCKRLNADKALLARLCQRYAGVVVPGPTCVGVDPGGLHVRASFGVIRVPFPRDATDADDAASMIESMARASA